MLNEIKARLLELSDNVESLSWKTGSYDTVAHDGCPSRRLFYLYDMRLRFKDGGKYALELDFYNAESYFSNKRLWNVPFPRDEMFVNKEVTLRLDRHAFLDNCFMVTEIIREADETT